MSGFTFLVKQESEESQRQKAERKAYDELDANPNKYTSKNLFSKGKELIENGFYCVAELAFHIAHQRGDYRQGETGLYYDLSYTLAKDTYQKENKKSPQAILDGLHACMEHTMLLYYTNQISRRDVLDVERWMNRINLDSMILDKNNSFFGINDFFRNYMIEEVFLKKN